MPAIDKLYQPRHEFMRHRGFPHFFEPSPDLFFRHTSSSNTELESDSTKESTRLTPVLGFTSSPTELWDEARDFLDRNALNRYFCLEQEVWHEKKWIHNHLFACITHSCKGGYPTNTRWQLDWKNELEECPDKSCLKDKS